MYRYMCIGVCVCECVFVCVCVCACVCVYCSIPTFPWPSFRKSVVRSGSESTRDAFSIRDLEMSMLKRLGLV
jgi:hypothetical protein